MDLDATMATMTDDPYVNHVPVMTGGVGFDGVRRFYGDHFIGKWPQDIEITPVSRTVGEGQVVDELVLSFTHDIEMPQLLPGSRADGEARPARVLRRRGVRGRQGRARAHLLGPGVAPRAGRTDRSGRAPGHRRRAGRERARPTSPSAERADPRASASVAVRGDLPTGTVTFLFTDIEGSTRLLHSLGPDAYAEALAEHRRVLREAFAAHGGVEVDTQGDAFFVAFPTADGAAQLQPEPRPRRSRQGRSRVRMGLHTGTPTLTGEGYVGVGRAPRSPRRCACPRRPGRRSRPQPRRCSTESSFATSASPAQGLRGRDPALQLGDDEFPPLRTPGSIDLPTPATRFLGRERELFDAVSLVYERDPRVLTILGPGGTGKTRFAIELARLLADEADGGTVFVPLAPLRDAGLVLPTIADRLGAASGEPARSPRASATSARIVVSTTSSTCFPPRPARSRTLVGGRAGLRLFATSREPLRIQGEVELDLPPLADARRSRCSVERARAVRPDIERERDRHRLCERLDRLPLALELAAARTKLLAPEALLERLGESLDLLKGTRDADERHATLRATIAWSLRPPRRARATPLRAAQRLSWRLHARVGGGRVRRGPRHARLAARQEPCPAPHGPPRRGAFLDARDDPRVRDGAARGVGRGRRRPPPPCRAHARDRARRRI